MNATVKEQILDIRNTGLTNMVDANMVQFLANQKGYAELIVFIEEHKREYVRFILTGEE